MIGFRTRRAAAFAATITIIGCDRRDAANSGPTKGEALAATPQTAQQAPPYTTQSLTSFGRIGGFVELDGPPPPDTVFQPTVDQQVCGTGFTRRGIDARGNRIVGVVVSIDGIRSGKPMPLERRFEIANDRCLLVPEIQTAVAGGTLNVRSDDAIEHRTRITRLGDGEVVATIRETDEGQVVPDERVLARPGVLELSCAAHSWTHAWIAVFDHPYFGMTGTDGSFAIDSVPPGRYQVRAWHPRLGAVADSITIVEGQTASLTLRARARRP